MQASGLPQAAARGTLNALAVEAFNDLLKKHGRRSRTRSIDAIPTHRASDWLTAPCGLQTEAPTDPRFATRNGANPQAASPLNRLVITVADRWDRGCLAIDGSYAPPYGGPRLSVRASSLEGAVNRSLGGYRFAFNLDAGQKSAVYFLVILWFKGSPLHCCGLLLRLELLY